MRVLLTGASGFVGRQCYRILREKGHEVIGLCNNNQVDPHMVKLNLLSGDLTYIHDFIKDVSADTLIHAAWYVGSGYKDSIKNLDWIVASLNLIKCFYKYGGQRALTVGTCFEYDFTSVGCYENVISRNLPHTLYGLSKLSMYNLIKRYTDINNLNYIHARLFYLFGSHESPNRLVPSVATSLLKEEIAKCSHGDQIRDFMCVEDVADALVTTMEASQVTGLINIGSGRQISIKELTKFISTYLNKIDKIAYGTIDAGDDPPYVVASTYRLNKEVGWTPNYTLDAGLAKTLEWIKENYKKNMEIII